MKFGCIMAVPRIARLDFHYLRSHSWALLLPKQVPDCFIRGVPTWMAPLTCQRYPVTFSPWNLFRFAAADALQTDVPPGPGTRVPHRGERERERERERSWLGFANAPQIVSHR